MECYKLLSTILLCFGLVLDIIGVCILFKWEPPLSGYDKEGNLMIVTLPDDNQKKEFNRNKTYSKVALSFLVFGFILQIIGTILSIYC